MTDTSRKQDVLIPEVITIQDCISQLTVQTSALTNLLDLEITAKKRQFLALAKEIDQTIVIQIPNGVESRLTFQERKLVRTTFISRSAQISINHTLPLQTSFQSEGVMLMHTWDNNPAHSQLELDTGENESHKFFFSDKSPLPESSLHTLGQLTENIISSFNPGITTTNKRIQ